MKWIDLPPVWTCGFAVLAWIFPTRLENVQSTAIAGLLMACAIVLTIAAVSEFRKADTSIVPRTDPNAILTTGVFAWSRNPIYLADLLILTAITFWFGSLIGFALIPVLFLVLKLRFVIPEEKRLERVFGEEFKSYAAKVPRWLLFNPLR